MYVTETFITIPLKCIKLCGFDTDSIIVEMLLSTLGHHIPDAIIIMQVSTRWSVDHKISIYVIYNVLTEPDIEVYFHN